MKIYTFGLKQTFPRENRLEALKYFITKHEIEIVVDVRSNRGNRYPAWNCNGNNIDRMIRKRFNGGVTYRYCTKLGITWKMRKKFQDHSEAKIWYLSYLDTNEQFVKDYFQEYKHATIVLLCTENLQDPTTPWCHRLALRDWLYGKELGEIMQFEETVICRYCGGIIESADDLPDYWTGEGMCHRDCLELQKSMEAD